METQNERILKALMSGRWISGMAFLRDHPPITRVGARIYDLKQLGYEIESRRIDGGNWSEYRLLTKQPKLI